MVPEPQLYQRISAYALLVKEDHILLCRISRQSDSPGQWTMPGGGIDFGEDPMDAVKREVLEETGLVIQPGTVLDIDSRVTTTPGLVSHAVRIIYDATVIDGDLVSEMDGSTDLCEWIALDQISSYHLVPLAEVGVQLAMSGTN